MKKKIRRKENKKEFCPKCGKDLGETLICEDYMHGCYCSNCGFDYDKYLDNKK